jgi:hypothetical protein
MKEAKDQMDRFREIMQQYQADIIRYRENIARLEDVESELRTRLTIQEQKVIDTEIASIRVIKDRERMILTLQQRVTELISQNVNLKKEIEKNSIWGMITGKLQMRYQIRTLRMH